MNRTTEFLNPITGTILDISKVPDEVFADKIMGDGYAIDIDGSKVLAPFDGEVTAIFPGGHAICIKGNQGIQVLIHIGLETHKIKNLYQIKVSKGELVNAGQLLVKLNLDRLINSGATMITPIVFLNHEKVKVLKENQYVYEGVSNIIEINFS